MKGPAESGQICSVGRRKIAKKIAKNKRCSASGYASTRIPNSRVPGCRPHAGNRARLRPRQGARDGADAPSRGLLAQWISHGSSRR